MDQQKYILTERPMFPDDVLRADLPGRDLRDPDRRHDERRPLLGRLLHRAQLVHLHGQSVKDLETVHQKGLLFQLVAGCSLNAEFIFQHSNKEPVPHFAGFCLRVSLFGRLLHQMEKVDVGHHEK